MSQSQSNGLDGQDGLVRNRSTQSQELADIARVHRIYLLSISSVLLRLKWMKLTLTGNPGSFLPTSWRARVA